MKIETISHPQLARVLSDYNQDQHALHSFFSYHPWHQHSFVERARRVDQLYNQNCRKQLVEVIRRFHEPELLHPNVIHNLKRLSSDQSLVVIGGQQAGMLTGPLYTIHKAITIIQLARREEERLGRPVIPVFWIAGEDHDRDEVDHVWVQNEGGTPAKLRFKHSEQLRCSVSKLQLERGELYRWLDELAHLIPDYEYKKEWLSMLKDLAPESVSWTRYFARIMHQLFGRWGLLLIDSADPQLRHLEVPFFKQIIEKNEQIAQSVKTATAQLTAFGYSQPVEISDVQANLFIEVDGERQLLLRQEDEWVTKAGNAHFTTEELIAQLELVPERFSNNVITRPLMQEYLFPTLAFVGGPGEIAYWAILKQAFAAVDLEMPIVYPRLQLTVLDRTAEKRMREFELSWEDVFVRLEQKRAEWLQAQYSLDIDEVFTEVKEQIAERMQPVIQLLDQEIGMDLKEMGQKNQKKLLEQVDFLYHYTKSKIEAKYRTELRHWQELKNQVLPENKPQERVYNLIYIWNRYGLCWINHLLERELLHSQGERAHHCITL